MPGSTNLLRVLFATAVVAAALAGVGSAAAGGATPAALGAAPAAGGTGHCSFPATFEDATGTEVTVEAEPERVVTLAPSAAQTMWEIGAREKVVGLSQYATYLEGAGERTNVSGASSFVSVETVVALEPDLVLAPDVIDDETVEGLRSAGLTVYNYEEVGSVEGIRNKTLLTGDLVGACEGATETVREMDEELATIREAVEGQDRPRVLYVFFGYTAGEGTFIDEMITLAGGENVASEAGVEGFKPVSEETVVQQDPEWIVVNSGSPEVPKSEAYNSTTAVQEGNVIVLQEQYVSQPAPRVIRSIRKMAKAFHPEAYAAANATPTATPTPAAATPEPTPEPTEPPTPTATATPSPTQTGAPGFGVLAGLVATLAGLAAARRRA